MHFWRKRNWIKEKKNFFFVSVKVRGCHKRKKLAESDEIKIINGLSQTHAHRLSDTKIHTNTHTHKHKHTHKHIHTQTFSHIETQTQTDIHWHWKKQIFYQDCLRLFFNFITFFLTWFCYITFIIDISIFTICTGLSLKFDSRYLLADFRSLISSLQIFFRW